MSSFPWSLFLTSLHPDIFFAVVNDFTLHILVYGCQVVEILSSNFPVTAAHTDVLLTELRL